MLWFLAILRQCQQCLLLPVLTTTAGLKSSPLCPSSATPRVLLPFAKVQNSTFPV